MCTGSSSALTDQLSPRSLWAADIGACARFDADSSCSAGLCARRRTPPATVFSFDAPAEPDLFGGRRHSGLRASATFPEKPRLPPTSLPACEPSVLCRSWLQGSTVPPLSLLSAFIELQSHCSLEPACRTSTCAVHTDGLPYLKSTEHICDHPPLSLHWTALNLYWFCRWPGDHDSGQRRRGTGHAGIHAACITRRKATHRARFCNFAYTSFAQDLRPALCCRWLAGHDLEERRRGTGHAGSHAAHAALAVLRTRFAGPDETVALTPAVLQTARWP